MPKPQPPGLQDVLAEGLRRVRRERQWSQDALARRATEWGLSWTRATVADLEATPRRREISLEEFLMLPSILGCSRRDLLRGHNQIVVAGARVAVRSLLAPSPDVVIRPPAAAAKASATPPCVKVVHDAVRREAEKKVARALHVSPERVVETALSLWGRNVTEERDRRLQETTGAGDIARRRGHITRRLTEEIRQQLAKGKQ